MKSDGLTNRVRSYRKHRVRILYELAQKRKANLEKARMRDRAYYQKHKAKDNAACARYLEKHREEINARKRRHYKANRDRILAEHAAKWRKDIEASRKKAREQNQKHKIKNNARGREKYRNNREYHIGRVKAYFQNHPEVAQALRAKRRARKIGSVINPDAVLQYEKSIRAKKSAVCYWCKGRFPISEIHIDHIVALALGGPHALSNLCVSCETCNLKKNAKPLSTWAPLLSEPTLPL